MCTGFCPILLSLDAKASVLDAKATVLDAKATALDAKATVHMYTVATSRERDI